MMSHLIWLLIVWKFWSTGYFFFFEKVVYSPVSRKFIYLEKKIKNILSIQLLKIRTVLPSIDCISFQLLIVY